MYEPLPEVTDEEFDRLISRAMDDLPQEYIKGLDNVAIVYADEPDKYQAKKAGLREGNLLLGLYEGIPLTARGAGYTFVLPDKITLFKYPIMAVSHSAEAFYDQIKRTLWHEIAHYYGLDHRQIDALEGHA
jgi:predicted Zn-dependent protease with MMP-like domain